LGTPAFNINMDVGGWVRRALQNQQIKGWCTGVFVAPLTTSLSRTCAGWRTPAPFAHVLELAGLASGVVVAGAPIDECSAEFILTS
jgi:hypothetical protein